MGEKYNGEYKGLEIDISGIPYYAMDVLSVIDGELPSGMEFNGVYNSLCGTPTKSGTYNFTMKAEYNGASVTKEFSITIIKNPEIVKPTIYMTFANGTINDPYSSEIGASNGDSSSYEWDYSGTLPPGLTLSNTNKSTYQLSGTPNAIGTYTFTVSLWDKYEPENGKTTKDFTVTIADDTPEPEPFDITGTLPSGKVGQAYSATLTHSVRPSSMQISCEWKFPDGLEFNSVDDGNGSYTISGTPTEAGTFTLDITATSTITEEVILEKHYEFTIAEADNPIPDPEPDDPDPEEPDYDSYDITGTLPSGKVGQVYSATLTHSVRPSSMQIASKWHFPNGLEFNSFNEGNGGYTVSGTPTEAGTFTLDITATSTITGEVILEKHYEFIIAEADNQNPDPEPNPTAQLNITGTLINGLVGLPYGTSTSGASKDIYVMATGGTPPYKWSYEGELPSGLKGTILGTNDEYVLFEGTPENSGTYNFTLWLSDAKNTEKTQNFSISISEQTPDNINQYNSEVQKYTGNQNIVVEGDSPTIIIQKEGAHVNVDGGDDNTNVTTDDDRNTNVSTGGSGGGCETGFGLLGLAALVVIFTKRSR